MRKASPWLLVLTGLLIAAGPLGAKEPASGSDLRELAGHSFIPSQLVLDPFTSTFVNGTESYGYASASGPKFSALGQEIGARSYSLGAMANQFELQLSIFPFWSVRLGLAAQIYSGSSGTAFATVGANILYAVSAGTTFSWPLGRRFRLGGTFDFEYGGALSVNALDTVLQSIRTRQLDASNLVTTTYTTTLRPGISAALALHRSLGLVGMVQYEHPFVTTTARTVDGNQLGLGAVVDFDLHAITPVPIGMVAAYRADLALEVPDTAALPGYLLPPTSSVSSYTTQNVEYGIYYTGRQALVVGVDLNARWFPLRPRVTATGGQLLIVLRYFW